MGTMPLMAAIGVAAPRAFRLGWRRFSECASAAFGAAASTASGAERPQIAPQIAALLEADAYDYHLPEGRIADRPVTWREGSAPRDASRLLCLDTDARACDVRPGGGGGGAAWGGLRHGRFKDIAHVLPRDSLIVMNDSRVVAGRLVLRKEGTGGAIELLLIAPTTDDSAAGDGSSDTPPPTTHQLDAAFAAHSSTKGGCCLPCG